MERRSDYYVYVYIDPTNYEEFYYGKGCGARKECHLLSSGGSEKASRISQIRKQGLKPVIRVIAKDLTEEEALLVESTLIWKLGRNLTNRKAGHFSSRFRPQRTMHVDLPQFDFRNGIYYVNVSEGAERCWDDCRKLGFIAAGHGRKWSQQLDRLQPGDVVAAYQRRCGFLGVGVVTSRAAPVKEFCHSGKLLQKKQLKQPGLFDKADDPQRRQYLVGVAWKRSVARCDGHFRKNSGLYTPQKVVSSLARHAVTRAFIEEVFAVSLDKLASDGATGDHLA